MSILEIKNLKVHFNTRDGIFKAVDDISFCMDKASVFGIVGESGSGKTLTALSILKLISWPGKISGGSVVFNGQDILKMDDKTLQGIRGSRISIVFQEPASSFNPVFTIGEQIVEAITSHQRIGYSKAKQAALECLDKVRVRETKRVFHSYPHQLSGGTKQRAMIAMALSNLPELVILDEPTTALDVTIQAQILDLLKDIIAKEKLSILFISHDLGIISKMCDNIAVMRKGSIVEAGPARQVLENPKNDYTISLLESVKALS